MMSHSKLHDLSSRYIVIKTYYKETTTEVICFLLCLQIVRVINCFLDYLTAILQLQTYSAFECSGKMIVRN
jgi:hypothetical protein